MRRLGGMLMVLSLLIGFTVAGGAGELETPLRVESNADLAALPGILGSGTEIDPFILEGIQASGTPGLPALSLRNISAHTIIRNSTFSGAAGCAVELQGCSNIWILDCVFADNATAISATPDCQEIVVSLCTFERNQQDVNATTQSIALDDGYVGNWWDGNAPLDLNGDGLSEIPYLVQAGEQLLLDKRSLVFPYAGDRSGDPEGVRLEIVYSKGETFGIESTTEMTMLMHMADESTRSTLVQELTGHAEVLSAPGTGYAELDVEVIENSRIMHIDGMPYEGGEGLDVVVSMGSHRFGGGSMGAYQAGNLAEESTVGPLQFSYAFYPVRPISQGYRWASDTLLPPSDFGLTEGSVTMHGDYQLLRIEEFMGVQAAVISFGTEIIFDGDVLNESVGTISLSGTAVSAGTIWLELERGKTLRVTFSSDSVTESFHLGELLFTLEQEMSFATDLTPEF
jgi:hypothetical protein